MQLVGFIYDSKYFQETNYYYNCRFSHFSALAGKYSPNLGYGNQQDQARWSYLQFRKSLTIEHVPRITDFCVCIYVFGCKSSLFRLCGCDYGIGMILQSGSLELYFASTQHIFHSQVLGIYYYYYYYYYWPYGCCASTLTIRN